VLALWLNKFGVRVRIIDKLAASGTTSRALAVQGRTLEFYQQIKTASAKEHFIFLVGPPAYLSLTWADDVTAEQKEPQQWAETINRFLTAA